MSPGCNLPRSPPRALPAAGSPRLPVATSSSSSALAIAGRPRPSQAPLPQGLLSPRAGLWRTAAGQGLMPSLRKGQEGCSLGPLRLTDVSV